VLGDAGAQVGCTLADGARLRMIADGAAVAHGERVLPGFDKRLELRSYRVQIRHGEIASTFRIVRGILPIQRESSRLVYGPLGGTAYYRLSNRGAFREPA
jgi:hypothetical protein